MPFPTSSYGQADWSDYYVNAAALPGGSLTGGSGLQKGATELLFDGSIVGFFTTLASSVAGAAQTFGTTWIGGAFQLTPTTATLQAIVGVNDRAGGGLGTSNITMASNSYGWFTMQGTCYPLCVNALAARAWAVSSATTGQLALYVAGTSYSNNVFNLTLVGGSPAQSPCLMHYAP
jgi:hypothetical protein